MVYSIWSSALFQLFPATSLDTLLVVSLMEKKKIPDLTNQPCVSTADCVHEWDYGSERVSHDCDVQDRWL